jgi:MoaA/NifB/PqqE/SkfB family radical SAM enzyme
VICELNSCMNNCIFCKPTGTKRNLSEKELKSIDVHMMCQALDLRKRGFTEVEISGCDPIEYKKIGSFVKLLKEKLGFTFIQLSTHGRNLCEPNLAKRLNDAGLDEVKIPLYGSFAAIHDAITQQRGSFKETLQGIKNITHSAAKTHIAISSMLMQQNYEDSANILRLAAEYTSDISISIPCVSSSDDAKNIIVSFDVLKSYLSTLLEIGDSQELNLKLIDIPFCVFGFYRKNILNLSGPPTTSEAYNIPDQFRSNLPGVPSYRLKKKLTICKACKASPLCGGFYEKYIAVMDCSHLQPL